MSPTNRATPIGELSGSETLLHIVIHKVRYIDDPYFEFRFAVVRLSNLATKSSRSLRNSCNGSNNYRLMAGEAFHHLCRHISLSAIRDEHFRRAFSAYFQSDKTG